MPNSQSKYLKVAKYAKLTRWLHLGLTLVPLSAQGAEIRHPEVCRGSQAGGEALLLCVTERTEEETIATSVFLWPSGSLLPAQCALRQRWLVPALQPRGRGL